MTVYVYDPQCLDCSHFYFGGSCKAYPQGVPEEIKGSVVDHRKPYEGDNGITFQLRRGRSYPQIFEEFDKLDNSVEPITNNNLVKKNGTSKSFYKNGKVKVLSNYKDDLLDGKLQLFSISEVLLHEANYVSGKMEGCCLNYYKSGVKRQESWYVHDVEHGISLRFRPSGALYIKAPFINGTVEGIVSTYFSSGELKQEAEFKNGEQDGKTIEYDKEGNIIKEEIYKNNILRKSSSYKNFKRHGKVKTYTQDGTLLSEENYRNNVLGRWHYYVQNQKK